MCGIFGVIGTSKRAATITLDGLKNLEYRGYDSWGIAVQHGGELCIEKSIGKIGQVEGLNLDPSATIAIGHTRWATNGGVTEINAHPHIGHGKHIVVVHNGIIENACELRKELEQQGIMCISDTDTEIIPHLIERELESAKDFGSAVRSICTKLQGRYAFLALHSEDQTIIAARNGSPLIVGVGEDQYFIASDIPAFLEHTKTVQYLDDGEMLITDGQSVLFTDIQTGEERSKREIEITWDIEEAEKGEFDHFMMKEIMDQKDSIARAVNQDEDQIARIADAIASAEGTFLVACGTGHKACAAAEYFFSVIGKHHINVASAGEFKLYHHFLKETSLLIVLSQSGETADVLEAMEVAASKGAKVLSIVNVQGSTIDRLSDDTLLINAGPEKAVASTKAMTGQMAILLLIAYALRNRLAEGKKLLLETASMINDMLNPRYVQFVEGIAQEIAEHDDLFIIGKGWHFPMALESAIKIQEVSYIHAEGFAGGELKHGPLALIEEGTPCIVLGGNDEVQGDIINNALEIKARGGLMIGIAPENNPAYDHWIRVPDAGSAQAIVNIIPVQILAYFLAVTRGKDPDQPRNLAKSVTVK